jgi:hypothetical protein
MRLPIVAACVGWIALATCQLAMAQEPQWWTNQKKACGLSSSLDYNSWAKSGSPCSAGTAAPAGPTPQQQMGLALGEAAMPYLQQAVHDLFWGTTAKQPQPPDPAQQQRELAAQQLNNSGIFLLKQKNYVGAINEFQQALAITPNDPNVLHNLAIAKQQIKDAAVAGQTSGELGQLLGNAPANRGLFGFDQLTLSSVKNPNVSALSLVNLDSDAKVVDLRGTTKTSVDPGLLKDQLDGVLANKALTSVPPASYVVLPQDRDMDLLFQAAPPTPVGSHVVLPQDRDMELLFQPPQSTPSQSPVVLPQVQDMELLGLTPQSTPTPSHLPMDLEQQKKVDAIFAEPSGLDDILLQRIQDDVVAGRTKPAPAAAPAPAPVLPHN